MHATAKKVSGALQHVRVLRTSSLHRAANLYTIAERFSVFCILREDAIPKASGLVGQ